MKACDRHARAEGALKAAPINIECVDTSDLDEYGRPKQLLSQELCKECFDDFALWYREVTPVSLYAKPLAVVEKESMLEPELQ